jgi:hypothetical protein
LVKHIAKFVAKDKRDHISDTINLLLNDGVLRIAESLNTAALGSPQKAVL